MGFPMHTRIFHFETPHRGRENQFSEKQLDIKSLETLKSKVHVTFLPFVKRVERFSEKRFVSLPRSRSRESDKKVRNGIQFVVGLLPFFNWRLYRRAGIGVGGGERARRPALVRQPLRQRQRHAAPVVEAPAARQELHVLHRLGAGGQHRRQPQRRPDRHEQQGPLPGAPPRLLLLRLRIQPSPPPITASQPIRNRPRNGSNGRSKNVTLEPFGNRIRCLTSLPPPPNPSLRPTQTLEKNLRIGYEAEAALGDCHLVWF